MLVNIAKFKHQAVRDLAWSCFGPDLIAHFNHTDVSCCDLLLTKPRASWLRRLDDDPSKLMKFLKQQRSPRLGIYFEALWQFFISEDPELELIASNQPLQRRGKTLGEFDIVYRNKKRKQVYHLELAIKFYLDSLPGKSEAAPLSRWLGPNGNDSLVNKINRLLNHQIMLSDTDEAKHWLASKGVRNIQKQIALKGQLFSHFSTSARPCRSNQLASNHSHYQWLRLSEVPYILNLHNHWLILEKPFWISPVTVYNEDSSATEIYPADKLLLKLQDYFQQQQRPVLLCALQFTNEAYREAKRCFVCNDNWPIFDL